MSESIGMDYWLECLRWIGEASPHRPDCDNREGDDD